MAWLVAALSRRLPALGWGGMAAAVARTGLACAAMGIVLWWITYASRLSQVGNLSRMAVAIPAGVVVFVAAARALRCRELFELLSRPKSPNDLPDV